MDEKESKQFEYLQGLLGTLLLALNWDGWAEEERIALLRCIDCLERKLIDAKQGCDVQNPATGIEQRR